MGVEAFDRTDRIDEDHKRIRALELRVDRLDEVKQTLVDRIERLASEPTDIGKLNFNARTVVAIVAMVVTVFSGIWASTYGLRSDVRDILTHQSEQAKLDASNAALIAERASTLREKVDMIEKKQELQRLEIQSLRETILGQRSK